MDLKNQILRGLVSIKSNSAIPTTETERTLKTTEDRVAKPTLLQSIFMLPEHRKIAKELKEIGEEQNKDLALAQIQAVAGLKQTQLVLDGDKAKARIREEFTLVVGEETRTASMKMVESMKRNLTAENKWQRDVAASDCLPEDKQFLASLSQSLARHRIETTAKQHKVDLGNSTEV